LINQVLIPCETGGQAIESLVAYRRLQDPRFSHRYHAKKMGLNSTGLLSDVIAGRRRLAQKFWRPLCESLGLDDLGSECLCLLLERDAATEPAERQELNRKVRALKKALVMPLLSFSGEAREMYFASQVYAAFSLYGNRPTRLELRKLFGVNSSSAIDKAIVHLKNMGLIGERGQNLHLASDLESTQIEMKAQNQARPELTVEDRRNVHLEALEDAKRCCVRWFGQRAVSNFNVAVVSVSRAKYESQVQEFRNMVAKFVADLESDEADMLVTVVAQISPAVCVANTP
jgi:uncharacterized protein (TIGR02147 family)